MKKENFAVLCLISGLSIFSSLQAKGAIINAVIIKDTPLLHLAFVDFMSPLTNDARTSATAILTRNFCQPLCWSWDVEEEVFEENIPPSEAIIIRTAQHNVAPHPEESPTNLILPTDDNLSLAFVPPFATMNSAFDTHEPTHTDFIQGRIDEIGKGKYRLSMRLDHTEGELPPRLKAIGVPESSSILNLLAFGSLGICLALKNKFF